MYRYFALAALAGLAACTEQPSQARMMLDAACAQGDRAACGEVVAAEQAEAARDLQRRQVIAAGMQAYGASLSAQANSYRTTTCTPGYGGAITCNSW